MPTFLARSISLAKWNARENISADALPADAVTIDLRTKDNILSFWICNPTDENSLQDVALAIASTRDTVQRLDIVWLEERNVARMDVAINPTVGETPAKHLNKNHRDIVGIDLLRLVRLARSVGSAVGNQQTKRFTAKEVEHLLLEAVKNGIVSAGDLRTGVSAKI